MITLSKLKRAGGEETPRFEAFLHFNGREIARVANGGTGGACSFWWLFPQEDRGLLFSWSLDEARRRQPKLFRDTGLTSMTRGAEALDFLVMDEVEIAALSAKLDRACRTKTLVRFWGDEEGRYREIPIKYDSKHRVDPRVSVTLNTLEPRERALRIRTTEPKEG